MSQEPEMKQVAETLVERVDDLLRAVDRPVGWGHALCSTTPNALALEDLALRTQVLETAVREIALEVQNITRSSVRKSRPLIEIGQFDRPTT